MASLDQTDEIQSIAQDIQSLAQGLDKKDASKNGEARVKLQEAAKQLSARLESPPEAVFRHAFETSQWLCTRLGITLRLFHLIAEKERTAEELAGITGAEQEFIVRIMRVLNCIAYVKEVGEERYAATALTHAMTAPPMEAAVKHNFDYGWEILYRMPEYFQHHGYRSPADPTHGPFQFTFDTPLNFWDYIAQRPTDSQTFNTFMEVSRMGRSSWVEWFDIQQHVIKGFAERGDVESLADKPHGSDVLLVDVGGGHGHDLRDFRANFPDAGGRLVLQDLPAAIKEARGNNENGGIELMEHDFFTPQPIKGARAYFFHFVFHDWADADARRILQNIATAMTPGYSRLILNEALLPNKDWSLMHAVGDIHIMALLAAAKRSQKQFQSLIDSAGLKVVKFWDSPDFGEGVIEIVREA